MARRLKGKAQPETPQQRADRLAAQKEAEKMLPVVYGIICAAVLSIMVFFKVMAG